jgi:hypothetical protein
MFPFIEPFLCSKWVLLAKSKMYGNDVSLSVWSRRYYGSIASSPVTPLRYCPQCFQEDSNKVGYGIWRCIHQYWPLKICPHHSCNLVETQVRRMDRVYLPIEEAVGKIPARSTSFASPLQTILAKNLLELEPGCKSVGPERLRMACKLELRKAGYETITRAAYKQFTAGIVERFGADELRRCHTESDNVEAEWANPIFRSSPRPLFAHHCNVVCALVGIPLQQLLKTASDYQSDEFGPWPCKSVGLPCSGKKVIVCARGKGDRFVFMCPQCQTYYNRPAPLVKNMGGSFDHWFNWNSEATPFARDLARIWRDPKQNWASLKLAYNKEPQVIAKCAARLGLPDMPGRNIGRYRQNTSNTNDALKLLTITKRTSLEAFIRKNPTGLRKDAPREILTLYNWLIVHDTKPPPGFATQSHKKKSPGKTGLCARDFEVAEIIRAGASQASQELKRPRTGRVSITALLRFFAPKIIIPLTALRDMPRTYAQINALVETAEQLKQRRFEQALANLESSAKLPPWYKLAHNWSRQLPPDMRIQLRTAYLKYRGT